jgi:hypothetical protein
MFVPQILAARRRTSCIAADRPNRTSSGGNNSVGLVVWFLLGFSDGILA